MHEVLVNRLGGLSLPRTSVVRLTDRPDMNLDVYRGRKTTIQQQQQQHMCISKMIFIFKMHIKILFTPVEDGSYYVVPSVIPSLCLSVRPSVNFSCPLHNSDTVQGIFMILGTNINHHQTRCRE